MTLILLLNRSYILYEKSKKKIHRDLELLLQNQWGTWCVATVCLVKLLTQLHSALKTTTSIYLASKIYINFKCILFPYNKCTFCMLGLYYSLKTLVYSLVCSSLAFPNNNKTPFKMKLDMRSLSCSGVSILQHQYLLSLQVVTRNWQKKKRRPPAKQGCSVFRLFMAGLCCNHNHIWLLQWADDEMNESRQTCEV